MTVRVNMGTDGAGAAVAIDLEELLATRLLVQGNSGSGKSHLLRRLLERSAGQVQQVIIDPEGDFVTLSGAAFAVGEGAGRAKSSISVSAGTDVLGSGPKLNSGKGSTGANNRSFMSAAGAVGSGVSLGLPLRAEVSTEPILTEIGRLDTAGPSARKVPRCNSRIVSA